VRVNKDLGMSTKTLLFMMLISLLMTAQPIRSVTAKETDCSLPGKDARLVDKGTSPVSQENIFRNSYAEAECLRRAAAKKGAEWLETNELLRRSLKEADKGNWEEAFRLVQKAHFQADRALRQADYEAKAWKHRVVDQKGHN